MKKNLPQVDSSQGGEISQQWSREWETTEQNQSVIAKVLNTSFDDFSFYINVQTFLKINFCYVIMVYYIDGGTK